MLGKRFSVCLVLIAMAGMVANYSHADSPQSAEGSGEREQTAETETDPYYDEITEAGQRATGVYLPGNWFRRRTAQDVVELVEATRTNAVVIDLKDGSGRVTYDTDVPELADQEQNWIEEPEQLLSDIKEAGVYTIGRIVCFADPLLPARYPERSILHIRRDRPWTSWGTGGTWLDPYNRDNHEMIVELAREAEEMGFDEVQLDYVRFPVDEGVQYARYPADQGESRSDVLIELLQNIDRAIHIPVGVDVFGLAAYREGDPSGLGQDLRAWADHVEVISPMLYLNAMRTWRVGQANRSRLLIEDGVSALRRRVGPRPVIRPYLQAFSRGAGHEGWNGRVVAQQIRGARFGGSDGFLMWHPGARYGMFRRAMSGPARGLSPFPIDDRLPLRARSAPNPQALMRSQRAERTRPQGGGVVARPEPEPEQ